MADSAQVISVKLNEKMIPVQIDSFFPGPFEPDIEKPGKSSFEIQ